MITQITKRYMYRLFTVINRKMLRDTVKAKQRFYIFTRLSWSVFSSQGTKLWIIMEYLGGGSALDLVRRFIFFIQLTKFYSNLAKWHFLYLRGNTRPVPPSHKPPPFSNISLSYLHHLPSSVQGLLKRLTLLLY